MPLITRPVITATDYKPGDRLLVADLPADAAVPALPLIESREYPTKGKNKGKVLLKVAGKAQPLVFERDETITVERQIPTQEERDAYIAAFDRWYRLNEVVEAAHAFITASETLRDHAASMAADPASNVIHRWGRSVVRDYAQEAENAAGALRVLWTARADEVRAEGWTLDDVLAMARVHRDWSSKSASMAHYQPEPPRNADCFEDGHSAGSTYRCVPLSRARHEAEKDAPEPEPVPLLVDRYARSEENV